MRWNNGYSGESYAGGVLTLARVVIQNVAMAGLQLQGLAADHAHVYTEALTLRNVGTAYPASSCRDSLCASPVVIGDVKHQTTLSYYVGGLTFGPNCRIADGFDRPWLSFVGGAGSLGVADISGAVSILGGGGRNGTATRRVCNTSVALPSPIVRWGDGVDALGLSVEARCVESERPRTQ